MAFVLCGAIILLDGYDLQALGLAAPVLAHRWAISPSSLGPALSASLVGLGIASALLAPLGDRFGRRPVLTAGLLCVAVSAGLTALADNIETLAIYRFLTGAGLGVCQANATALAAEWAPRSRRASVVTIVFCQVALGALLAGLVSPTITEWWDWPGIFVVGALGPLFIAMLVWIALPESPTFLAGSPHRAAQFRKQLRRLAHGLDPSQVLPDTQAVEARGSLRAVLGPKYLQSTLAFWTVFAVATFVLYLLISWLPIVLTQAGWSPAQASRGISMYQGGGIVGALILARFIDRGLTFPILVIAYVVAGFAGAAFHYSPQIPNVVPILLCLLGVTVSGGLCGVLAVGATLYPTELRATGLGLGAAVARVGAMLGPLVGGWALAGGASPIQTLSWLALPASLAVLSVMYLRWATGLKRGARDAPLA
jgi:AAHS family 4-hydroxybenzoate transporter-like MFS transporter